MSLEQPRPVATIDQAIANVRATQCEKLASRDRALQAMKTAAADADRYEQQASYDARRINDLFEERARRRILDQAEAIVRP